MSRKFRRSPPSACASCMERIVDAAGVEATIEVREDADGLHAEFVGDGDDLGLLIGHHGQTIDAIQHLAYRIASPATRERVSVLVDAAGLPRAPRHGAAGHRRPGGPAGHQRPPRRCRWTR